MGRCSETNGRAQRNSLWRSQRCLRGGGSGAQSGGSGLERAIAGGVSEITWAQHVFLTPCPENHESLVKNTDVQIFPLDVLFLAAQKVGVRGVGESKNAYF